MLKSKFIFLAVMAGLFFYAEFSPAEELKPLYPYRSGDNSDPRYMKGGGSYRLAEDLLKIESINPDNVVWRSLLDIAVRQPDGSIEIVNVDMSFRDKTLMLGVVAALPIWGPLALAGVFDNPEREMERQQRIALGNAIRSSPPLSRPAYELGYTFPDTDSYLGSDVWGPGQEFISGADGVPDPINGGTINPNSSMGVIAAGVQAGQESLARREAQKYGYTTGSNTNYGTPGSVWGDANSTSPSSSSLPTSLSLNPYGQAPSTPTAAIADKNLATTPNIDSQQPTISLPIDISGLKAPAPKPNVLPTQSGSPNRTLAITLHDLDQNTPVGPDFRNSIAAITLRDISTLGALAENRTVPSSMRDNPQTPNSQFPNSPPPSVTIPATALAVSKHMDRNLFPVPMAY